jgi:hypothetical protein
MARTERQAVVSGADPADPLGTSGADPLGPRQYVLRRKPPGQLLPSAHAVEREYRVMTALMDVVPVPRTHLLCEDPDVIGTPFFLMEYVAGHPMTDASLPHRSPAERRAIYESIISVLARLHTVDWRAAGLADYGKPGHYVARQVHRWTAQYRASETERIEAMERLIEWLPAHIPPGDERRCRPRRLPPRQPAAPSHRPARLCGDRLGAFHDRPSARGSWPPRAHLPHGPGRFRCILRMVTGRRASRAKRNTSTCIAG